MLIGIDGNEANVGERVGVNVWAFGVLKHLQKTENKEQKANNKKPRLPENTALSFQVYLSRPPLSHMPPETPNWQYRVIGPGKFWTRWRLPLDLYLHRPRPDIFLSLSHYAPKFAPMPTVVSIMDLSFLNFPEAFKPAVRWQLVNWTKESVRKATHIIAISEFTKQEIVREYKVPSDKVTVVYPGISDAFKGPTFKTIADKYGITGKYLLFVGTLQPKKNLPHLIQAFEIVKQKHPDVQLVVAGKAWSQFATPQDTHHAGVRYVGFVPDEDLVTLLARSEALVLPSLYEGFGIPVVEAMSIGTPVLASNVTSLPEIVGDAGILFDPNSADSMAEAIVYLLTLPQLARQQQIEKGKIRSGMFDWNQAAKNTVKILLP